MGFLIDAVVHRAQSRELVKQRASGKRVCITTDDYLAEYISSAPMDDGRFYAGLSLMVWILKREVRAFGGCLGMYRRRRTWHAAISVGEL